MSFSQSLRYTDRFIQIGDFNKMNDIEFWFIQQFKNRLSNNFTAEKTFPVIKKDFSNANDFRNKQCCGKSASTKECRTSIKPKIIIPAVFKKAFLSVSILLLFCLTAFAQWTHPLEPIGKHYKTLAALSPAPNTERAALDLIEYPWAEYRQGRNH